MSLILDNLSKLLTNSGIDIEKVKINNGNIIWTKPSNGDIMINTSNSEVLTCGTCNKTYQDHYWQCSVCGATFHSRTSYCTCGAYPYIDYPSHFH